MPFPFAAIVPVISSAAATVAGVAATAAGVAATAATAVAATAVAAAPFVAAPFVAAGAAVVGGLAITGAIIKHNEEERDRAYWRARRAADRENERRLVEEKKRLDAKMQKLKDEYGSDVSKEEQEQLLLKTSEILGGLQGNRSGLEEKGQTASAEAINAEKELQELQDSIGLTK